MAEEGPLAQPSVVGVLVDEALAVAVDENAALEAPGLRGGQRDGRGIHVHGVRAGRDTEADPRSVVAFCTDSDVAARMQRSSPKLSQTAPVMCPSASWTSAVQR